MVLLAFVVCAAFLVNHAMRDASPRDPEHAVHRDFAIGFAPGLSVRVKRAPLYASNDPWKAYLADDEMCPNAEDVNAPLFIPKEPVSVYALLLLHPG